MFSNEVDRPRHTQEEDEYFQELIDLQIRYHKQSRKVKRE